MQIAQKTPATVKNSAICTKGWKKAENFCTFCLLQFLKKYDIIYIQGKEIGKTQKSKYQKPPLIP